MPLSTYDELQAAILNWLARAEDDEDAVVDTIKDFITLAETRMSTELRVRQMMERVAAPINDVVSSMPARFLEPISASIIMTSGQIFPLKFVTAHELSRGLRNVQGDPCLYTIVGGQILFSPVIEFDDTVSDDDQPQMELIGYFSQPPLSETNQENDILKYYPNIYLYGALLEATAFVTADQLTTWAGAYEEAVGKANDAAQAAIFESSAQEPPPYYAVI